MYNANTTEIIIRDIRLSFRDLFVSMRIGSKDIYCRKEEDRAYSLPPSFSAKLPVAIQGLLSLPVVRRVLIALGDVLADIFENSNCYTTDIADSLEKIPCFATIGEQEFV